MTFRLPPLSTTPPAKEFVPLSVTVPQFGAPVVGPTISGYGNPSANIKSLPRTSNWA